MTCGRCGGFLYVDRLLGGETETKCINGHTLSVLIHPEPQPDTRSWGGACKVCREPCPRGAGNAYLTYCSEKCQRIGQLRRASSAHKPAPSTFTVGAVMSDRAMAIRASWGKAEASQ